MKVLTPAILVLAAIVSVGCGGGGSPIPGPTPTPSPTPATSGEYMFEGNSLESLNVTSINSSTGAIGPTTLLTNKANDDVIYPGVGVTPSKQFLYATFSSFTMVEGFQISGPGFQITQLKNAPFFLPNQGGINSMILHPSGQFLYVVQSPQTIQELSANSTTGDLTPGSATTASGADLRVATIDPSGKFLYATDLTGGRAFGYQIDPSSGSLTAIAGSPFTVASTLQPNIPVIDSTGHFLYVSLLTGIAAFAINGSTGALTPVPGSPFSTASQPVYLATDPVGNFLYACTVTNGAIEGFAIDPTTGVLTSVGPPVDTTQFTSNIIVDPSGKFVYVSIESGSSIYGFSLNPVSGALSPLAGSPFASIANPTNLFIARF